MDAAEALQPSRAAPIYNGKTEVADETSTLDRASYLRQRSSHRLARRAPPARAKRAGQTHDAAADRPRRRAGKRGRCVRRRDRARRVDREALASRERVRVYPG